MRLIVITLYVGLLLGAIGLAAVRSSGAAAKLAKLSPAAGVAPNQVQTPARAVASSPTRFDHISTAQGLSSIDVWSVLRDRRGFMWFGTLDGLNRYDGYKMKVFKYSLRDPTSLSENTIRTIYEDRSGNLWIGTWTGGLNRFERASETFTRFRHDPGDPASLSSDSVFAILEDRAGRLWLGTRGGGLNRFDPATGIFTHYGHDAAQPSSLTNDNVFALWEDASGSLWVGTDGGLDCFDPASETFSHYRNNPEDPASLSNDVIRSLFEDSSGTLWVGTWGGGLNRFDRQTQTFTHYRNEAGNPQSLSNDGIFAIDQDATGALWIGTFGGGLNRLDLRTGTFRRFEPDGEGTAGFGATEVYDMVENGDLIWFATNGGVFAQNVRPKPFRIFQHDPDEIDSLAGGDINAVYYEDGQGILWVATVGTGLNRVDRASGQVNHYQHDANDPSSLSPGEIWFIAPARDGTLWLANYDSGLDRFDPETGQALHYRHDPDDPASLGSDRVTTVLEDRSGVVWVGTWDSGLDRFDPSTGDFNHFSHDPADPTSLSDNAVLTLDEDRNNELWIGTLAGGLNRFDRNTETFSSYRGAEDDLAGLPFDAVSTVYPDRAGAVWVGAFGGGMARLNPVTGEVVTYNQENGLPSDAIIAILEDDNGLLWISTSNGLARFDPRTETFRNYDESDGLPGNVFRASTAYQAADGEMFFGAKNGLLAFYPDQIRDNLTVPPVVITELLLANEPVPIGDGSVLTQTIGETGALVLSYLDRVISFEFAALNYDAPQKNRYRYKLEGFDPAWTEVGSDRRLVTYTNLDPGEYVFRVLGSNNDGVWNEEGVSLALTITPPWWETTWLRVLLGFLVVGTAIGGFAWQQRMAASQRQKLEGMVVERTRELQDARTQISTLFDSSPLGICMATVEGKILGTNRALRHISGYSEDELLGSNVTMLYAFPQQRMTVMEQLKAMGYLSNYGIQLRRRDGSFYYASLSMSRLEMAGQEVLLGITDDITGEVKAREALTTLHQISYDLATISDIQTLLAHALQHLRSVVDFQQAALMLVEDGKESLTMHAYFSRTLPPEFTIQQAPASSWPSLEIALTKREATYVPDMQANETIQAELDGEQIDRWAAALKISRSWLSLPLLAGPHTIGLLNILHGEVNHYTENDVELVRTFANQLAVAIENIRLNERSRRAAAAGERSRIARELHDSVTQTLFTASVMAEATPRIWGIEPEIARRNMERLSTLLRGALAEMRALLLELRSDALPNPNLGQLLNTLAEAARGRSNLAVWVNVEGDEQDPPAHVTKALYRITQEALNNATKHAEATRVDIALLHTPDRVELHIRDDGRGFDPHRIAAGHLGIGIMAERANEIGGNTQITSNPGRGTEVSVTWLYPTGKESHA